METKWRSCETHLVVKRPVAEHGVEIGVADTGVVELHEGLSAELMILKVSDDSDTNGCETRLTHS